MKRVKSKISHYAFLPEDYKGYLEISFTWLFAIIVGAVILFIAIFAVSKFIKLGQTEQDVKTSEELGVLLNPLEIGFETAKVTAISFPAETRVYNKCTNFGAFGEQKIQTQQKSFNKWSTTNIDSSFENKYIFSERYVEGKKIYVFSKPFEFPFKVGDLIYITSSTADYCFEDASEEIKEEITTLKEQNLFVKECPKDSIKICFEKNKCDINVDYNGKTVEKKGEKVYFEGDALMYGAIFSDAAVYECQLKRLMQRTEQLSALYMNKESLISQKCNSNLGTDLLGLQTLAENLESSEGLYLISNLAEDIKEKNEDNWECRLW